jgi:hypothetical protein
MGEITIRQGHLPRARIQLAIFATRLHRTVALKFLPKRLVCDALKMNHLGAKPE